MASVAETSQADPTAHLDTMSRGAGLAFEGLAVLRKRLLYHCLTWADDRDDLQPSIDSYLAHSQLQGRGRRDY